MIEFSLTKRLHTSDGEIDLAVGMSVDDGEFVTLFGKSGAGKTTILRMLSGLVAPDDGHITVNGERWFDRRAGISLPPQRRRVGLMFQDYALFPNMTVRKNLEFGLRDRHNAPMIGEILQVTDLVQLQDRLPAQLSGGQKQRVALARALVCSPSVLLLDEPLSALEAEMRERLQQEIAAVHDRFGLTTIMVSHDVGEISRLSDRVCRLDKGKIVRTGTADEVLGASDAGGELSITGTVGLIEPDGRQYTITLSTGDATVRLRLDAQSAAGIKPGDRITINAVAVNPQITGNRPAPAARPLTKEIA